MTDIPVHDVVIIGSGFGGTMTALTLAHRLKGRASSIRILERGTWWTTPVSTVQDKKVATYTFLKEAHGQPVQYWSSSENSRGAVDLFLRCVRRPGNEDGLYDLAQPGTRGFLGLGRTSDGVTIVRACGVGGGSLVYSNITVRPPDLVFDDPAWPLTWDPAERDHYYDLARHAIGYGVISAWTVPTVPYRDPTNAHAMPPKAVNAGLSNISTRSARLNPAWEIPVGTTLKQVPLSARSITANLGPKDPSRHWIDRARIFQGAISKLTNDFGTVDSSINDLTPEGSALNGSEAWNYPAVTGNAASDRAPINYCERQGRCNVGCLPGARHTLNKQLMRALYGKPGPASDPANQPDCDNLSLEALAEVDTISALPDGGYRIDYWKRDADQPKRMRHETIRARRVIVAAGCLGTNEILLRSKARGGLPHLSHQLGHGFSTNGDYIAFLDGLDSQVSLTRGPATTSFGHFNTPEASPDGTFDPAKFHIIEDQGIPRALASTIGIGIPLIRRLANKRPSTLSMLVIVLRLVIKRLGDYIRAWREDAVTRQEILGSEDETVAHMMCIVAQGRERPVGRFRLENNTTLRLDHPGRKAFSDDPIYEEIRKTLKRLAAELGSSGDFVNPFISTAAGALRGTSIATSHPLGGCRMGATAQDGVADEYGRVFNTAPGAGGAYRGLYIADGAIMPTSLGVNPSLTISALSLRIADNIIAEWDETG